MRLYFKIFTPLHCLQIVLLLLLSTNCSASHTVVASSAIETAFPDTLRIMSFNIRLGGREIADGWGIIAAIDKANADIVGIQEPEGDLHWIRERLKARQHREWYLAVTPLGTVLLSRYPFVEALPGEGFAIELQQGSRIAVFNRHLRAYPYSPYSIRDGQAVEDVIAQEQFHLEQMQETLAALATYKEQGWPVFLTADFNVPSHLDWGQEHVEQNYGKVVAWPLSVALEQLGMIDSFRQVWPDVLARPGHTWTCGWYPSPNQKDPNEKHDRIDYVYYYGEGLQAINAQVLGPEGYHPSTDIEVQAWGSDHRAVVSSFQWQHNKSKP